MKRSFELALVLVGIALMAWWLAPSEPPRPEQPAGALQPLPRKQAPALATVHRVTMVTDAGELLLEVYPEAAPRAAQRFLELVELGFYDDTPIFRVVTEPSPFVAQFGINWRGDFPQWQERTFQDDPSFFRLDRGTLAFAKGGPDTNSTQIFINYADNSRLADPSYNFTAFGRVVGGMEVADKWRSVGDPSRGLDQDKLWSNGGDYLAGLPEKPNMIVKMQRD